MQHKFIERERIVETAKKLFVSTDNQEWLKLQSEVFNSTVALDMVSMGTKKAENVSSREICHRWEKAFKELDAVHHRSQPSDSIPHRQAQQ